ncbi:hypothetical protein D3C72_1498910 [compost metagenome]
MGRHRRRPRPGLHGRRGPRGHGVHPVPPHRHGVAPLGEGHPRHRGRPRRRRLLEEQQGRAVHVELHPRFVQVRDRRDARRGAALAGQGPRRPSSARAVDSRRRRARHRPRGQRGPWVAARRRVPGHLVAPGGLRQEEAALDVPPVQGARRPRHHQGAHGSGPHRPLHHGRRAREPRDPGEHRARPVRLRRGRGRPARRQPPGRQLAVGPLGLRPPRRRGCCRVRQGEPGGPQPGYGPGRQAGQRDVRALREADG